MNERFDTAAALTAFIAALIGGGISYLQHSRAYTLARAVAALFMSGLAGLLCWLACTALNLPDPITAICTGFAGHMGAELTRLIEPKKVIMKDITPLIETGNDWQYEAIQNVGPEEFKAFLCSTRGSHCIGTFKTSEEASAAIKDAKEARWHG